MQNWFSYGGVSTRTTKTTIDRTYVLVDLVESRNSLDDVVVLLVHAELHLGARVCVAKTENGAVNVAGLELLDELAGVLAETTEEVRDYFGGLGGLAGEVGEGGLDASGQVAFAQTESNGLLLASLGKVGLESRAQKVGQDTFRDIVNFLKRILGSLERRKADELDGLSELVKILHGLLDFGKAVANGVGLQNYFEDLRRALATGFEQKLCAAARTA